MSKQDELLHLIRTSDLVLKAEKLKRVIELNPKYLELFQKLLSLQKKMVQKDQSGDRTGFEIAKEEYEKVHQNLLEAPAVAEYLNCTEELNSLMMEVTSILNESLNFSKKDS